MAIIICVYNQRIKCPNEKFDISGETCMECTVPQMPGAQCLVNLRCQCPDHKVNYRDEKECKVCQIPLIYASRQLNKKNAPFKLKFEGVTIKVQELSDDELITERCLYQNEWFAGGFKGEYHRSRAAGDKISEHPTRRYVKVLSVWWK